MKFDVVVDPSRQSSPQADPTALARRLAACTGRNPATLKLEHGVFVVHRGLSESLLASAVRKLDEVEIQYEVRRAGLAPPPGFVNVAEPSRVDPLYQLAAIGVDEPTSETPHALPTDEPVLRLDLAPQRSTPVEASVFSIPSFDLDQPYVHEPAQRDNDESGDDIRLDLTSSASKTTAHPPTVVATPHDPSPISPIVLHTAQSSASHTDYFADRWVRLLAAITIGLLVSLIAAVAVTRVVSRGDILALEDELMHGTRKPIEVELELESRYHTTQLLFLGVFVLGIPAGLGMARGLTRGMARLRA